MPRNTEVYVVSVFGGLNDLTQTEIAPAELSILQNFYPQGMDGRVEYYISRNGSSPVASNLSPTQDFDGLEACRISTSGFLFGIHNGDVRDILREVLVTNGDDRFTSGTDTNGVFIVDRMFFGDGVNQNVAVTGTACFTVMSEQPVAGSVATVASGSSTLAAGTYTFKFTFDNYQGEESEPSEATSGVTITANQGVRILNVPQPLDPDSTGINVYAKESGEVLWKLATTLAVGTESYILTNSAYTTGTAIRTGDLTRFPPTRLVDTKDDRLWGAYSESPSGDKVTVYASRQGEYGICPVSPDEEDPTDGYRFQMPDEVTGMKTHGSTMAVFTAAKGFLILGDQPRFYSVTEFSPNVGCLAARSIRSIDKGFLIWLAPDGVYTFDGRMVNRISDKVKDTIDNFTAEELSQCESEVWEDRYYLFLPSGTLVYDFRFNQWVKLVGINTRCAAILPPSNTEKRALYASRSLNARVWQLEVPDTFNDNGLGISCVIQTGDWHLGAPFREKRLDWIGAHFKKTSASLTVTAQLRRATGNLIQTATHDTSTQTQSNQSNSRMLHRAVGSARDEFFSVRLSAGVSDEPLQINEILVAYRVVK